MDDAPVTVIGLDEEGSGSTSGSGAKASSGSMPKSEGRLNLSSLTGVGGASNAKRTEIPDTGDEGVSALAGGLAVAGAAALAYERRRAKNESDG